MIAARVDGAASGGTTRLAFVCIAAWVIAATSTRVLGTWLAIGGAAIALGTAVLVFDRSAARASLRPSLSLVLVGAVVGAIMTGGTHVLYSLMIRLAPLLRGDVDILYSDFRAPSLAVAALALGPVVLGEEMVWRGVVQTMLSRRFGRWTVVPLTAIVYALALAPRGSPALVLAALLCGLIWSALRTATKSLVPAVVAHLVWDLLVLLWSPLDGR